MNYYWKINDGRIWSSKDAMFVDESNIVLNGINTGIINLHKDGEPADVDYLIENLRFYKLDLGELKQSEEIIVELKDRLVYLDNESIRPMDAILEGTDTQYDLDKLATIRNEKRTLRTQLQELGVDEKSQFISR
jgi:hypothetical protein